MSQVCRSRRFHLERDVDVSGVAGDHRSTVVWESIADVEAIHGHDGATRIVWDH